MLRKSLGVLLGLAIALSVFTVPTFAQKKTNQGKLYANDADAPMPNTSAKASKSKPHPGNSKSKSKAPIAKKSAATPKSRAKQAKTPTKPSGKEGRIVELP